MHPSAGSAMPDDAVLLLAILVTWGWVEGVADRLESLETEIDALAEAQRVERLAPEDRDALGRFAKQASAHQQE